MKKLEEVLLQLFVVELETNCERIISVHLTVSDYPKYALDW